MRPECLGRFALIAGMAILMAASSAHAQQPSPPRQVGVIEMRREEVPRIVTLPGRAVAAEETAIRPRVSGMITEILYRAGAAIEQLITERDGAPFWAQAPSLVGASAGKAAN